MKEEELKEIVQNLREHNLEKDAFFGFMQYGGGPDESFIKANKEGIRLYAAELLEASVKNVENNLIDLRTEWTFDNADFFFDYIEISGKIENQQAQEVKKTIGG